VKKDLTALAAQTVRTGHNAPTTPNVNRAQIAEKPRVMGNVPRRAAVIVQPNSRANRVPIAGRIRRSRIAAARRSRNLNPARSSRATGSASLTACRPSCANRPGR
ncbi:MAG: hypothetical protein ABL893_08700, partial [Hyphomicrobium sp.]